VPDLSITVQQAASVPFAVAPTLAFILQIENSDPSEVIHTVVLRCQIQIEVARRRYTTEDQERLSDLFGSPDRWGETLRSMLWTEAHAVVPAFQRSASVQMQVPCTFDFNVAGCTRYFAGISDGEVPLCLTFGGTVFYENREGLVQVASNFPEKETRFRLPISVWREMMDHYYPNMAWLCLRRDAFNRLYDFKRSRRLATWEETIDQILMPSEELVQS
jgi:hypothetical protein